MTLYSSHRTISFQKAYETYKDYKDGAYRDFKAHESKKMKKMAREPLDAQRAAVSNALLAELFDRVPAARDLHFFNTRGKGLIGAWNDPELEGQRSFFRVDVDSDGNPRLIPMFSAPEGDFQMPLSGVTADMTDAEALAGLSPVFQNLDPATVEMVRGMYDQTEDGFVPKKAYARAMGLPVWDISGVAHAPSAVQPPVGQLSEVQAELQKRLGEDRIQSLRDAFNATDVVPEKKTSEGEVVIPRTRLRLHGPVMPSDIRFKTIGDVYKKEFGDELAAQAVNDIVDKNISSPKNKSSSIISRFMDPAIVGGVTSPAVPIADKKLYLKGLKGRQRLKDFSNHTISQPQYLGDTNEYQKMAEIISDMAANGATKEQLMERMMLDVNDKPREIFFGHAPWKQPPLEGELPSWKKLLDDKKLSKVPSDDREWIDYTVPYDDKSDLYARQILLGQLKPSDKSPFVINRRVKKKPVKDQEESVEVSPLNVSEEAVMDAWKKDKEEYNKAPAKPVLKSVSDMWGTFRRASRRGLVQDDTGKVDIVKSSTASLFKSRMKGSRI